MRATLAAADLLGDAHVVAVPLPSHGDPEIDHLLGQQVVATYAPGEVMAVTGEGDLPDPVAEIVTSDQPAPDEQGLVVFFTGLSGSGKSTLARALHDLLLEDGRRTVTSLDGDVVRRNLSAGLTFSKADRETNIRRIGWVAAEIARHRGVAICSPIAPFDETRSQVRAYGRGRRRRVLPRARRDAARGVRAPRPEGSVRQGPARARSRSSPASPRRTKSRTTRRCGSTPRAGAIEDALGDVLAALADTGSRRPVLDTEGADPLTDLTMDLFGSNWLSIMAAGFFVGIVVGLTGMGGGALMTPALIFLGVGDASTVVTADLTAAAVYKSGGAVVHWREGSPNLRAGQVADRSARCRWRCSARTWSRGSPTPRTSTTLLKLCIGFALLLAAATYALRLYINLRARARAGTALTRTRTIRPIPTVLVGALGGLLVGITSVGSGSVIMIALLMLYPGLSAVKLVGTDLVQAVPLVLAAAISNIALHGLDWSITIPLVIGSVPGHACSAAGSPRGCRSRSSGAAS